MAYIATSDYIEYANVHSSDYDTDGVAEGRWSSLIERATAIIETYTRRNFEATAVTGTSDAPVTRNFDAVEDVDGDTLFFDEDICTITTVTNGDAVVVSDTEYVTEPRNIAPYFAIKLLNSANKHWTYTNDYEDAISVAGVWAFSATPPNDIKHATLRLTKWLEDQRKSDIELDRPVLGGEGSIIMPLRLPNDVMALLKPYVKLRVG